MIGVNFGVRAPTLTSAQLAADSSLSREKRDAFNERSMRSIRAIILRKSRCYMIKPLAHSRQYDFKLRGTRRFKEILRLDETISTIDTVRLEYWIDIFKN